MDEIRIDPPRAPLRAAVRVPPSKSLTNRAIALASLAHGTTRIASPLLADDPLRLTRALASMGIAIEGFGPDEDAGLIITGGAERFGRPRAPLDVGGSGTAMRFLTALAAFAPGEVIIDGDTRMRERPIGPLVEALRMLGVDAVCFENAGRPPVRVCGGDFAGGTARIAGNVSSQFVSALLMIAPLARHATTITVDPPIISRPYIDLTLDLMARFGIRLPAGEAPPGSDPGPAQAPDAGTVTPRRSPVAGPSRPRAPSRERNARTMSPAGGSIRFVLPGGGRYEAADYAVPPDASSASYMLAAAAVTGGRVTVLGLHAGELQPDAVFPAQLEAMGCELRQDDEGTTIVGPAPGGLRPFDLDLANAPDLAPTLAVVALYANGPSRLRNVANLRLKESDRLRALATELRRLGARVEEHLDGLDIVPAATRPAAAPCIETYNDHRIAMAFGVAGLAAGPGIRITDPGCVGKSFPGFWTTLASLCGRKETAV